MTLYNVKLKGMQSTYTNSKSWGNSLVVADNIQQAVDTVIKYCEEEGLGFSSDRILDSVVVVASEGSEHQTPLFLPNQEGKNNVNK